MNFLCYDFRMLEQSLPERAIQLYMKACDVSEVSHFATVMRIAILALDTTAVMVNVSNSRDIAIRNVRGF